MSVKGGIHTNNQTTVKQYFHYYSKLVNQQNMLQDHVRTQLYRDAILLNPTDFKGKVVMDVGAGSGILSIFAAMAGAKKVYAIEASKSADNAKKLIKANGFERIITVLESRIEDLTPEQIPEGKVDVIVSEPLGTFLLNERMLETYVIARQLFLKPEGRMFPARADLCVVPFSDTDIYNEQLSKCEFWRSKDFYGVDLSDLYYQAVAEKFSQPVLDTYDAGKNLADKPFRKTFDFENCTLADLQTVSLKFKHKMNQTAILHGYAVYFDAIFSGSDHYCVLHTGPEHPATHWYQTRLLLPEPLGVNKGQMIDAELDMKANTEQTFDTVLTVTIPQLQIEGKVRYDMKDAEYRGCYQSYADYYNQGAQANSNWTNQT